MSSEQLLTFLSYTLDERVRFHVQQTLNRGDYVCVRDIVESIR